MHRPYNDVAAEMTAALPADGDDAAAPHRWRQWLRTDDSTKVWLASTPSEESTATLTSTVERALPGAGVWLIVVGLAAALYALVRIVVQPLYALTLWGRPAVGAAEIPLDASAHALLIGPPGAGKTLRLLSQPRIRVFDTRTQSFFERRSATESIPFERRSYAYATAEEAPVFAWSGPAGAQAQPMPSAIEPDRRIDWLDKETLPADPAVLIGVDHLEHSLDSRDDRVRMLRFLEELIYRHQRIVWIAAAREPIGQLQELSDARPDAAEMTRWIRVLQPFREVRVGLADVGLSAEAVDETAAVSAPYYRAVWTSCSKAEQLALRQLADEGVVNPNNGAVVAQLMRSGLVRRTSSFRLASERFRLFVLQALEPGEVTERERAAVALPWASVTTAMLTVALGLGALLVLTSQQLVDAWIGYVPALAPAVPTVMKLLATARQDGKGSLTA
jgi:hypothetical protein